METAALIISAMAIVFAFIALAFTFAHKDWHREKEEQDYQRFVNQVKDLKQAAPQPKQPIVINIEHLIGRVEIETPPFASSDETKKLLDKQLKNLHEDVIQALLKCLESARVNLEKEV